MKTLIVKVPDDTTDLFVSKDKAITFAYGWLSPNHIKEIDWKTNEEFPIDNSYIICKNGEHIKVFKFYESFYKENDHMLGDLNGTIYGSIHDFDSWTHLKQILEKLK